MEDRAEYKAQKLDRAEHGANKQDEPTKYTAEELDERLQRDVAVDKGKLKYDEGKLRVDLVPPEATVAIAEVLGFGTTKHTARSWERGIAVDRVLASVKRHLLAYELGEDFDESGLHHFDHALCEMAMLVTYERRKMLRMLEDAAPGARVEPSRTKARVYPEQNSTLDPSTPLRGNHGSRNRS